HPAPSTERRESPEPARRGELACPQLRLARSRSPKRERETCPHVSTTLPSRFGPKCAPSFRAPGLAPGCLCPGDVLLAERAIHPAKQPKTQRNRKMKRSKIGLIGAGNIGGELANLAMTKQLGDVVLFDIPPKENFAKGKALDLEQASTQSGSDANIIGSS